MRKVSICLNGLFTARYSAKGCETGVEVDDCLFG
jgi:hypothetical protein